MCSRYVFLVAVLIGALSGATPARFHNADQDQNNHINLSELLRVIQFYNSEGLHADAGSEDGFAPGLGKSDGAPHHSDYNPQDWSISLSELLRLIQFYNTEGYYGPVLSEDGFASGATENPYLGPAADAGDSDGDYIRDNTEVAIGYDPNNADENENGVLDGIDLALRFAQELTDLQESLLAGENQVGRLTLELAGPACETSDPITGEAVTLQSFYSTISVCGSYGHGALMPGEMILYLSQGSFLYQTFNAPDCSWTGSDAYTDIVEIYKLLLAIDSEIPSTHLQALEDDSDGDFLTDLEELAIGYDPYDPDENRNTIADGLDLAQEVIAAVYALPQCDYKSEYNKIISDKCGIKRDLASLISPVANLKKTDDFCCYISDEECEDLDPVLCNFSSGGSYYLASGEEDIYLFSTLMGSILGTDSSFSFYAFHDDFYTHYTSHRLDVPRIVGLLGLASVAPDTHQIELEGDSDGDYLTDAEEEAIGYLSDNPDENDNGVLDGIDLAQDMAARIEALPNCPQGIYDDKGDASSGVFFTCGKKSAPASIPLSPVKDLEGEACVVLMELDCYIADPVLNIEIPDSVYNIHRGEAGYNMDIITLRILESGSLSVCIRKGEAWVYERLPVALLHQLLY